MELDSAQRQIAKMPEQWRKRFKVKTIEQSAPLPSGILHIWEFYQEIALGRSEGFSGPGPIGWPDIHAWGVITGNVATPMQARLILITDAAWRSEVSRLQKLKRPQAHG